LRHFFQIFSIKKALGSPIRPNWQKKSRNPQVRPRFAPIPKGAHRQTNHPDRLEPAVALADTYVCERSGDFIDFSLSQQRAQHQSLMPLHFHRPHPQTLQLRKLQNLLLASAIKAKLSVHFNKPLSHKEYR